MTQSATLGFPRIGPKRELKHALEAFWKGALSADELTQEAAAIRSQRWQSQAQQGVDIIPSNDFTLYDHVLDAICMLGAVPPRFEHAGGPVDLACYFRMARGGRGDDRVAALEMTKWFDSNYHYLVPEFVSGQTFSADASKIINEWKAAKAEGIETRPVILGPLSFLLLGKSQDDSQPLDFLEPLLAAYKSLLTTLADYGITDIQIDEPCLVLDLDPAVIEAYQQAYPVLAQSEPRLRLLLATYFGSVADKLSWLVQLPIDGLHVDLVRAPEQIDALKEYIPKHWILSLGVVDARNIWRNHVSASLAVLNSVAAWHPQERLQVAASASLLHTPVDLSSETRLDAEATAQMAFAVQKCAELKILTRGLSQGAAAIADEIAESDRIRERKQSSPALYNQAVRKRCAAVSAKDKQRLAPFSEREAAQAERLQLPLFPSTTIGSFPQTAEVRRQRRRLKNGSIDQLSYDAFIKKEIQHCITAQEEIGLDVLVHGEFERNDMVEYFGELLDGFVFTDFAWVQSYGSRCVKPPVIIGDVARSAPMTVEWTQYAQSLTDKPVKGMLTGPVTILNWSFVRDDIPRSAVCEQIALALRDEICDLEAAGIAVIQVDEPALREGLPLRQKDWAHYLNWASEAFRLACSGVQNDCQIHTHMCYSEFNDIIEAIASLDADVITIETTRSQMELLSAFEDFHYPNAIGPGVYDIHSPAIPPTVAMQQLLEKATRVLDPKQIWVNPDCGLKTRAWDEVKPALRNMIAAAQALRQSLVQA